MRGKMHDDETKELLEYYDSKEDIYWDGKKMPFAWVAMEYGENYAEMALKNQKKRPTEAVGRKSPLKVVKDFKPKENKHKQKPIDGQFLALEYEKFFNNGELMKKIANKLGLLLVLLRHKVDWDKNERLNLYQEYFVKRNLIAASISRPRLAEMFGKDIRRITAWAKALEEDGIIKIERIRCMDDDYNWKKYNVYILGEVNDDGSYTYYYE